MAKLNTILDIRLKVLSPVHIGTGNVLVRGVDFVQANGYIHLLDKEKLYLGLTDSEQEHYLNLISRGSLNETDKWIQETVNLPKVTRKSTSYDSSLESNELRPLIRDGNGHPYIPGSSIKGAIRSVLFNYLWKRDNYKEIDRDIENRLLGSFKRSITRYIQPSDAEIPQTEITDIALFNLQKPGFDWKSYYGSKGIPSEKLMVCETYSVGAESNFRLSLADGLMKLVKAKSEGVLHPNTKFVIREDKPIQYLFKFINEYTREHLRREIAFFEAYPEAEHTDFIIHQLYELMRKTENNARSCILRMSFGSGYHGITGDWMVEDHVAVVDETIWLKIQRYEEQYHLKSRRIAKNAVMTAACMGFVELALPEGAVDIPFDKVFKTEFPTAQIGKKTVGGKIEPPKKEAKTVAYASIKEKTVFQAQVIEPGKPFSKVKLLIDNYPFEPFAQLSGTKKVQLQPGMIVEVVVNSRSKEGEIKQVTYWG
jgi:CRISPR/Cas system CSM-associated protein Csm5 (group 7 of RAMP superfamily)